MQKLVKTNSLIKSDPVAVIYNHRVFIFCSGGGGVGGTKILLPLVAKTRTPHNA